MTADGRVTPHRRATWVDVVRRGFATAATLEFDPDSTERDVVEAVANAAAAEIDNVALRAELARQVEQIRVAGSAGQRPPGERRRIERDLHDGAQQRLLAIALQLQSARSTARRCAPAEIDRAIQQLGATVQELRDLANGLQPAALAGGGLRAAIEDLAAGPVRCARRGRPRFAPVESAAWFVVAEGVTNAVKHARRRGRDHGVVEPARCTSS